MKKIEDICQVSVRFSEVDSMKRAWHGSYVAYLEDGRESFGRHYPGIGYEVMQQSGVYAPIYDMHLRYFAPLMINDRVEIHTRYVYKPGARLDYHYRIYRLCDNVLCAEGETTQLFINSNGDLMTDKPDYYRLWQDKYIR